jgi:hypothetical protein
MAVFWGVAPCNLVEIDRHFRATYCLHHQGDLTKRIGYSNRYSEVMQSYEKNIILT